MKIPVHLLAFSDDRSRIRYVEVPDRKLELAEDVNSGLEMVFAYGQNDFQPQPMPSVSVGDVIEYFKGRYFMVLPTDFKELTKDEFDALVPPTSAYAYSFGFKYVNKENMEGEK